MIRSDLLRQALEYLDSQEIGFEYHDYMNGFDSADLIPIVDAARFALRVWEGDEQLVERVAAVLEDERASGLVIGRPQEVQNLARAVLAVITEEEGSHA